MMREFEEARRAWSEATFGTAAERGPIGPLKHLEKEAREAYTEADPARQREEIADCVFLVFDAASRAGMTLDDLARECWAKLEKNKRRQWVRTAPGEPIEHLRTIPE